MKPTSRMKFKGVRHEERFQDLVHDAYKATAKMPGSAVCPDCGASYRRGRWTWQKGPAAAKSVRCPACQRIQDDLPAGYVMLSGTYFRTHRDEVLARVRRCEADEKREHPLQRIMKVAAVEGGVQVTTTDSHLARTIGEALHKAFRGELDYRYNKRQNLLRVAWAR
jgi:NMD protein affecting ribosome stability and mRNA decay